MWMLGILYIYDRVEKDVGRGYGWRFNENIKNFETLRSMLCVCVFYIYIYP